MAAKPIRSGGMVSLQTVMHQYLLRAENMLMAVKRDSNLPGARFRSRANLQRTLAEIRIMTARMLVLIRSQNSMSSFGNLEDILSSPEAKLKAFQCYFDQLSEKLALHTPDIESSSEKDQEDSIRLQVQPKNCFARLLQFGIPKRIKIVKPLGRRILFSVPREYTFSLKIDRKTGKFRLHKFSLVWPKEFTIPTETLASLTAHLRAYESNERITLHAIDRILHNLHMISKFITISKSIKEHADAFGGHISRTEEPNAIELSFPMPFGMPRRFQLHLTTGKLVMECMSPVYVPRDFTIEGSTESISREVFNRIQTDTNELDFIGHVVRLYLPDGEHSRIEQGLTQLRDIVAYTRWHRAYQTLVPSIRSLLISDVKMIMDIRREAVTFGRAYIANEKSNLLTIGIDPTTGCLKVCNQSQDIITAGKALRDGTEVDAFISNSITAVLVDSAVDSYHYGMNRTIIERLETARTYTQSFSFAPDSKVHMKVHLGHPNLTVVGPNGKKYIRGEIAAMESKSTHKAWMMLRTALYSTKRLMLLLQVQHYLAGLDISSMIQGDVLHIDVIYCSSFTLKVSNHGWRLKIIPVILFIPTSNNPVYVIMGSGFTARCAMMLANLIYCLMIWICTDCHFTKAVATSAVVKSLTKSNIGEDVMIQMADKNSSILQITFCDNIIPLGEVHHTSYSRVGLSFIPSVDVKFNRKIPISRIFNRPLPRRTDPQDLMAFVSHYSIPILEFVSVFCDTNSDWSVTNLGRNEIFHLIYKRRYTLVCMIRPLHTFVIYVPQIPPSMYLVCCLNPYAHKTGIPLPINKFEAHVPMSSLIELKNKVAWFCGILETVIDAGFMATDLDRSTMHLKLSLNTPGGRLDSLIGHDSVTFTLENGSSVNDKLHEFMRPVPLTSEFIAASIAMIKLLLGVSTDLLDVVLEALNRIRSFTNLDSQTLCHCIESFFSENGFIAMQFPYASELYCLKFRDTMIIIERAGVRIAMVNSVQELIDALRPGFFEDVYP